MLLLPAHPLMANNNNAVRHRGFSRMPTPEAVEVDSNGMATAATTMPTTWARANDSPRTRANTLGTSRPMPSRAEVIARPRWPMLRRTVASPMT